MQVIRGYLVYAIYGFVMSTSMQSSAAGQPFPEIDRYIQQRVAEFDEIPASREADLEALAEYVRDGLATAEPIELTFVCTHNSRRSHLAQLWAKVAAGHYGIANVNTYSGGTEVTAMNPRAIAALQRAGMRITTEDVNIANPRYRVTFQDALQGETCYSKLLDAPPNPRTRFCAVMTCSQADASCPVVVGCDRRIAITYEDPKQADDTPFEEQAYDERSAQISREMLYAMSRVQNRPTTRPNRSK